MLDKFILKFSKLSPLCIIILTTIFVLFGSMPSVYFITKLYGVEYTHIYIILSLVLPMLLTPPIIYVFIKLSKHLKYFKDELELEIEQNRLKDIKLFEQARFVLMGEMMENISHQWKQPLNTINLTVVDAKFSELDNYEKHFDIIEDNVNYLASTINDFMSFFDKKIDAEMKSLPIIIQEVKSIIAVHLHNKDIVLDIEMDSASEMIQIRSSISQIILNLLSNAKDAMIETNTHKIITLNMSVTHNSFIIKCCDNGKGIDDMDKTKIFDPYFTTKDKNQGVGIRLYMSKQIVTKIFDGEMGAELSDMGETCFFVDMPFSQHCIYR